MDTGDFVVEDVDTQKINIFPIRKKMNVKDHGNELPKVYVHLQNWIEENNYKLAAVPFDIYMSDPNTTAPEKVKWHYFS